MSAALADKTAAAKPVGIDLAALAAGAKVVPIGTLLAITIPIADPLTAVLVRASFEGWRRA